MLKKYVKSFFSSFHYGFSMQLMKSELYDDTEKERILKSSGKHIKKAMKWSSTTQDEVQWRMAKARHSFLTGDMSDAEALKSEALDIILTDSELQKDSKLVDDLDVIFKESK